MNEQLSFEEAKRLSIIKWEAHVNADGYKSSLPKELEVLDNDCGFCERTKQRTDYTNTNQKDCSICELAIANYPCSSRASLFSKWANSSWIPSPHLKNKAEAVLDLIKSLKENS